MIEAAFIFSFEYNVIILSKFMGANQQHKDSVE